jgi:hypothetical protein
MSLRSIFGLCLTTSLYLLFELAFNARLLDVVGGTASTAQVHNIEIFGRLLSGTAAALVVLQLLMSLRSRSATASPGVAVIAFCCGLTLVLVYLGLQILVDVLVARSSPEFRRQSLNVVLVQRALSNGQAELDGLNDDPKVFSRPEGKAFLALFPVLAVSVDKLDDKIRGAKLELVAQQVGRELGGASGYYGKYAEAMKKTSEQWRQYSRGSNVDVDAEVARQQDRAWQDYKRDLGRRGWTPTTVPAQHQGAVVQRVRRNLPALGPDWHPSHEASFRAAVETRVLRKMRGGGDGSVMVRGQRVPAGLGYADFVLHPGVQAELRARLGVPAGIAVAPQYASGEQFRQRLFDPLKQHLAVQEVRKYDAALNTFANGGANHALGLDAARAALVPPIALLCSLLGAIGHLGKLFYLLLRAFGMVLRKFGKAPRVAAVLRWAWVAPFLVIGGIWVGLSQMENDVTTSRLYSYLRKQVEARPGDPGDAVSGRVLMNAMHVVAVGQGYAYPLNEGIRTQVLGGISYGYRPNTAP